jgi:hypothetical protein
MTLPQFPSQNRPGRAVITLRGETALGFLDNLLTCDCGGLAAGSARYGALLTPQGKILHDVFVYNAGGMVLIDCATSQRVALLQKLIMYRLRAQIQIELSNDLEVGVHPAMPDDGMFYADPRNAILGWRSFNAAGSLINAPASSAYDVLRITQGFGDSDADIGSEQMFPHEANFDQMGAVSFTKGCYVGQEVVSRMEHRATARNRMLPVTLAGSAEKGDAIVAGDVTIGALLSVHGRDALALVRLDRLAEASSPLIVAGSAVQVIKPSWISYEVTT